MTDKERRKQENAAVIERMRAGDNLCHTGLSAYRWAPRPTIEKDKEAIKQLYSEKKP